MQKIYIDMDGVVADFDRGLVELLGIEPKPQDKQDEEYEKIMWSGLKNYRDGHFYADLKPIPGMEEAMKYILERFGSNCEILTGIPKPKREMYHAAEDKTEWVKKYISPEMKVNTVLRKEKINFCKGKGCILIDDFKVNIDEWNENGGTGILFTSWAQVLEEIKNDTACDFKDIER